METTQRDQKKAYIQLTRPREFQPGDQVLFLLLNATCKFLAHWQGLYRILKRVGPVNYQLQQLGKHADTIS